MRRPLSVAIAALLSAGLAGSAFAGGRQAARVMVDCSVSGSTMTVTLDAKTKGGGRPQQIASAGPVTLVVDESVDGNYSKITSVVDRYDRTPLPVTSSFDLCSGGVSLVDPGARAVRGRGSAYIAGVGFVGAHCSPSKPPAC